MLATSAAQTGARSSSPFLKESHGPRPHRQPAPPHPPPARRCRAHQGPAHRTPPPAPNPRPIPNPIPTEVEVRLRLPDAAAHHRLSAYLAPCLLRTNAQCNAFFDAPARPLAAATAALRVRLYAPDNRAPSRVVLARIYTGISRVEEIEEPLDPALALARVDDPASFASSASSASFASSASCPSPIVPISP
ncbi:triphosphate tunel metalloenzyme 3-like [Hordeum vulgare]|nr:triphosphate tunel metalloenzyme 3-like [Hordeum vulgare]